MNTKRFETLIFDFDGTLADTLRLGITIFNANSKRFGIRTISDDEIATLQGSSLLAFFDEFEIAAAKVPFILRYLRKEMAQNIDRIEMFAEMPEVLKALKKSGVSLGILTSNSSSNVKKFLALQKLDSLFDFVHSESSIFGKHRALNRIITKYKLPKETVLYVGDEVRDVEGAKKAGIKSVAVTWGFNSEELLKNHNPDFLVNSPEGLLKVLKP